MRIAAHLALPILIMLGGALWGDGRPQVKARLVANVDAVAAGDSLYLGVELMMAEGWHTYWQFAGDAGIPTEVAWSLPDRFEAGGLLWPAPSKYEEAGGLVTYGYADSLLLMSRVRVPHDLPIVESIVVGAEVTWLACRELCIPGSAELSLRLGVGSPSASDQEGRFLRALDRVPVSLNDTPLNLDSRAERVGGGIRVDLQLSPNQAGSRAELLDFYPIGGDAFESIQVMSVRRINEAAPGGGDAGSQLRLLATPYEENFGRELHGLLVYRLEEDSRPAYATTTVSLEAAGPHEVDRVGGQQTESVDLLAMDFRREERSFPVATYMVFALLGGFILNLMPCVLPVISIKVLSIVAQAAESPARIRQLGLAFSAGILATFMVLAVIVLALRSGGEQIGWGFQFQYPGFVMAMTAIVFGLALSLFGLFTVRLPGTFGAVGGFSSGGGAAASFANGVLATILATPCTAPFLGTALGFAFAQPAGIVLLMFACIGLGMALPYVLLALQPHWLGFVPRPGLWMERFKQSMGFLFLATSVWLLWVLGSQLGMEGVVWMLAFLLCLSLSAWIIGQWIDLNTSMRRRLVTWTIAVAITAGAYGVFLHPILAVEEAIASTSQSPANGTVSELDRELPWQPFSVDLVERHLADGQHVFIDFTANWCWTCKVNERTVLSDQILRSRFEQLNVQLVKADWTSRNIEITALLKSFGRSGVPLYVLFPARRPEWPIVLPEIITVGLVLDALDEAAAAADSPATR